MKAGQTSIEKVRHSHRERKNEKERERLQSETPLFLTPVRILNGVMPIPALLAASVCIYEYSAHALFNSPEIHSL